MEGYSLTITNWHNDGFCWYLYNTVMATSWMAMAGLTTLSFVPDISLLKDLAPSLFQVAIGS